MYQADLILPVENQVRELDAKLLLACSAAQRGYSVILGSKTEIDQTIYRFTTGSIYLAKSFAPVNLKMLRILNELGHRILAWDEEGLVHYPPNIYFGRRFTKEALNYIDRIIAWGEDYAELLTQYQKPFPTSIAIAGNPRGDLLRKELRPLFAGQVKTLQEQYGNYLLVNTNFPSVNSFDPKLNTCFDDPSAPLGLGLGLGSRGMPAEFARGRYSHLTKILEHFKELLPWLATTYPNHTIVLRPHPSENHDLWKTETVGFSNIVVESRGNVIPWILGSSMLIHNGCTTGVEAFAMSKPTISYEPLQDATYDNHLPSDLSTQCRNLKDLQEAIDHYCVNSSPKPTIAQQEQFKHFLTATDGALACERIVDVIDSLYAECHSTHTSFLSRTRPMAEGLIRHASKLAKRMTGSRRYSKAFQSQRFPDLQISDLERKVQTFSQLLQFSKFLRIDLLKTNLIKITA